MITRLEYYATAEVLLHRRVVGLRAHLQLFFLRLFFLTDGAGRFRADAAEVRASLYAHELQQVSEREVESRLQELHRARLIQLYTEGGEGYGRVSEEFWQQRDVKRKVRRPGESPPPPAPVLFTEPAASSPPPSGGLGKKPQAVCESEPPHSLHFPSVPSPAPSAAKPAPATGDQRPAAECLAELVARYPRHDVPAQIAKARRYVRKQRGDDAEVTVGWFIVHWMPGAAERPEQGAGSKEQGGARPSPSSVLPSPAAAWSADQDRRLAALIAGPEPERGTLDHAIWLEGRKST